MAATHGLGRVRAVTWDVLQEESAQSPTCTALVKLMAGGLPEESTQWPEGIRQFFPFRRALLSVGEVVMYGDRILIPEALHPRILDILHAGHSGRSTMQTMATEAMFWPGLTQDIVQTRLHCRECTNRSPSQPTMPPQRPAVPEYPFSHLCADFFSADVSYLAV